MCGIAGFVTNNSKRASSKNLRLMTDAIAHRGPDDEGFFEAKIKYENYCVGLGHRRLSIIDLDRGKQPMGNKDGTIQIVFNGEIYNFNELRLELISKGYRFTTESDTETIVHAYEEYGEACVEKLNGMFAFAIWDGNLNKLFLARDRFGQKPLFIYEKEGTLLFASEIKSLLTYPGIVVNVDQQAVWSYLAYRYVPGPKTLFEGVRKLPPGTFAVWQKGRLLEKRYYAAPDRSPLVQTNIPSNPVGSFLSLLDDAVRIRMVSDVPFGAFLSGGIDSSAVVGLMARHSNIPIKTFSVGFEDSRYSELGYAKEIADQFSTDHHELTVSQANLMDELPALIRYRDAPVSEPSDIPVYLLACEARKSVKMVLTGEGSDEFLGGYPKHVFERYVGWYQHIPTILRHGLIDPLVNQLPYRSRRAKTAILNLGLTSNEDRLPRWFGALSNQERRNLIAVSLSNDNNNTDIHHYKEAQYHGVQFDTPPENSRLRQILYFDQTSWLPDNLLERGDRMTMAASLEARMPFMDHNLAAYISALPDNFRVRRNSTKWILREAMKRLLPANILNRPKVGFRVPVNEWFRGPMRDFLYDHLTGPDSKTCDYYQRESLERILKEHVNGRHNHEKLLWTLLNLEIWHRQYLKVAS